MSTKICKTCGHEKSLNDFHRHPQTNDKRGIECKSCASIRQKKRYQENKSHAAQYQRNYRAANKEKVLATARKYYKEKYHILKEKKKEKYYNNPTKYQALTRAAKIKADYGITTQQYDFMVIQQSGRCAICSGPPVHGKRLAIDHCHVTGVVRGLLCHYCNSAIGLLQESEIILGRAIEYLKRPRKTTIQRLLAAERAASNKKKSKVTA